MKYQKYLFIFALSVFGLVFLANDALADVANYLGLEANTDIVNAGYYRAISTAAANFGNVVDPPYSQYNLNYQNFARVAQDGNLDHFQMYFASKPAELTSFKLEIWRRNESTLNWDRIHSEDMLSQVSAGTVNLTPQHNLPWSILAGDYVGYSWTASSAPGNFLTAITVVPPFGPTESGDTYYTASEPGTSAYNWKVQTQTTSLVPIKIYMRAPLIAAIGDSHVAGWFAAESALENTNNYYFDENPSYGASFPFVLANLLGVSVQNLGITGQVTSTISTRFTTQLLLGKPKIALIEGGLNDISAGNVTKDAYLTNMQNMIDGAVNNGIFPVVQLMNPFNLHSDAQMRTRDDWNASLQTMALAHGAIVVDNSNLGVFREGGDEGNKWDINPDYLLLGNDGSSGHFNSAGYALIAQNFYTAIYNHFKPLLIMSTDQVSISADSRVFGDERFRNKTTPSDGNTANLALTLPNSDINDWIDISISTWEKASATRHKVWTESSTATNLASGSTNIVHTVGDLEANKYYHVQVDSNSTNLSGAGCTTSGTYLNCLSNGDGKITFTYSGHYSTHTFGVEGFDDNPTDLANYLNLEPNADIVNVGYFQDISTDAANYGNAIAQYNLNYQNFSRIGQTGNVDHFQMYFASKPANLATFKLEIWRRNETTKNWDQEYSEDVLTDNRIYSSTKQDGAYVALSSGGGLADIVPNSTWAVQAGDYIGYSWTVNNGVAPGNFLTAITVDEVANGSSYGDTYYLATAPNTTNLNWKTQTKTNSLVPIKTWMQAPLVVAMGDSHVEGWFETRGPLQPMNDWSTFDNNPSYFKAFPQKLESLLGLGGVQNMGIGGQTTTGMLARFDTDVTPKKPKITIIEGGWNDLNGVTSKTQYLANMESMIQKAIANDSLPVVNLIDPFATVDMIDNAHYVTRDDWNSSLQALASTYGALVVDNSDTGVFRSGGTAGNLWDIAPAYLGFLGHYNEAGNAVIASNFYTAIYNHFRPQLVMGTDQVSTSADSRVFGDERFRNKTTPSDGNTANLALTLPNSDLNDWLDISISTWEKSSATRHKVWTESSTATNLASGSTNIVHTVGDLEANKYYHVQVDSNSTNLSGAGCTTSGENLICQADANGKITFTYAGHYSTHTFEVTGSETVNSLLNYLNLENNVDIVNAGYFQDISTDAANYGNAIAQYNLNYQNFSRIGQTGNVDHFQMYFASKPANLATFKLEIWRRNETTKNWDREYSEDFLSHIFGGSTNELTPSSTWAVLAGDYIGYSWTVNNGVAPGNFLTAITVDDNGVSDDGDTYYLGSAPSTLNYNWKNTPTTTPTTSLVPIKTWMQAPMIAGIGDSLMSGMFVSSSPLEYTNGWYSPDNQSFNFSFPHQLGDLLGMSVQNMGIGGQDSSEINARFETDVIEKHPKIAIIDGGLNDIIQAPDGTDVGGWAALKATCLANMQSMVDASVANGIFPVVSLMAPINSPTLNNTKSAIRDNWNPDLQTMVVAHGGIVFDPINWGVFRAGTSKPDNLWDLNPIYYGWLDHPNTAGYALLAQDAYDAIYAHFRPQLVMSTDQVSISADSRVFGDERFRNKTTPSDGNTANLALTLPNSDINDWIDISISTWEKASATRHKVWTESSTATNLASGSTNIVHTVGDLEANKYYHVQVDSNSTNLSGAGCTTSGTYLNCLSNGDGKITFTYSGHYSTHTFGVEGFAPTVSFAENVEAGPIQADTISAIWTDATIMKWDYNADTNCPATANLYSKTNLDPMNQADVTNNGKYICLYAGDDFDNSVTQVSANKINIDITPPIISNLLPANDTVFPVATTSTNLSLDTTEISICKYSTTQGTNYASMTEMDTTNDTTHGTFISGLNAGTTYHYYFKCQDSALNESSEASLTFSIDAIPTSTPIIQKVEIKIDRAYKKFKDTIRTAKNKLKLKQTNTTSANGTAKIYKGNKLWKTIQVDANGLWQATLKFKNNFSKWIKIKLFNQSGEEVDSQKSKIKVDTEKPKFTKFVTPFYSISKGQRLYWEATDNEGIDNYKVSFNGKTDTTKQAHFEVPLSTKNGTYLIKVKAYDKAGNYETKETLIRVRG